jgi:hypothetical protein
MLFLVKVKSNIPANINRVYITLIGQKAITKNNGKNTGSRPEVGLP